MAGEAFTAHVLGERLDQIRHACPAHPIGQAPALCQTCGGLGTVDEAGLARFVRQQNAEADGLR